MNARLALKAMMVLSIVGAVSAASAVSRSDAAGRTSSATKPIPLLRVGLTPAITNLDSARASTAAYVTSLGLETLMKIGPDGQLQPWLARSVSQPGRATYVYHLRRGVKFWDGNELTADDVANALNYNRYPGSVAAFPFSTVKSIVARGRYDVTVTLRHPDASFKWVVAEYPTAIFEKKFANTHKGTMGQPGVLTMGTGPWQIQSFDPTSGAELSANPHWWAGAVPISHISIKFFADETSEALAFRAGQIDVVPRVVGAQAFAAAANTSLLTVPSCQPARVSMNTGVAPFNDVHVRRAIAYAVNRSDLIKANGGYATPISTLIPPVQLRAIGSKADVTKLINSLPQYPFDLAKARQELAKSAYPRGFNTDIIAYVTGNLVPVIEAFTAELRKIGINVNIKVLPFSQWLAEFSGPADKRPFLLTYSGCTSPDPNFFTYTLGSKNLQQGKFNTANYAPPQVDSLITAGVSTLNPAKRLQIYGKLLTRLATDVPYIPLFTVNANAALGHQFSWPTFNGNWYSRVWALEIKAK
jgi:peptide/nickel transport system substrate-binding protein